MGYEAIRCEKIVKRFPGVVALKGVDFSLNYGEVHVIVGENGAGKSTLVKILTGVLRPDSGTILVKGRRFDYLTPREARRLGVFLTQQEAALYPNLSIKENILLSLRSVKRFMWKNSLDREHLEILDKIGLSADPSVKVRELSVGEQQLLQVAISIILGADILFFDEPTSSLSISEIDSLFKVIRQLKSEGKAIAFITHHLNEVFEIGDRVTVLRDGFKIATKSVGEVDLKELVSLATGKSVEEVYVEKPLRRGEKPVLEIEDLSTKPANARSTSLRSISLKLYEGEILAVLGLLGAGKTELGKAIIGLEERVSGRIKVDGREVNIKSPHDAKKHGIFYLPENRRTEGLVHIMSLKDNIALPSITKISRSGFFRVAPREEAIARRWVERLKITTPSIYTKVESLSGGNQQKVIIAKFLETRPRILIFDEPTIGIDVAAKAEIRGILRELSEQGISILLLTSDIDEAISLADRIAILSKGRIVGVFRRDEIPRSKIMEMLGS